LSEAVSQIFADWEFPVWLTLGLALTGVVYTCGWIRIRRTRRAHFTAGKLAWFWSGLAMLWLAVGSPVDGFADALLSVHMVEHTFILSVVPPMLLLAHPTVPLLRGIPRGVLRKVIAPFARTRWFHTLRRKVFNPVVAWFALNITFLTWHVPAAYNFALESESWHDFEHICFFLSALFFWYFVVLPWPSRRTWNWGTILYLVAADAINTVLSAFLALCDRPIYAYYLQHPNPFHIGLLQDQVFGAAAMWVLGSIAFLVPAVVISVVLLQPARPLTIPSAS
jgi:putative membrane protein